jgi:hypothetical protein
MATFYIKSQYNGRYSNKEDEEDDAAVCSKVIADLTGYEFDVLLPLIEKLSNLVLQYEGSKFQVSYFSTSNLLNGNLITILP